VPKETPEDPTPVFESRGSSGDASAGIPSRAERFRRKFQGPDRVRMRLGLALYVVSLALGLALNVRFFEDAFRRSGSEVALLYGALPAGVMLLLYLPVPSVLDRFDPEPWWSLLVAFGWGALVATGLSGEFHAFAAGVAAQRGTEDPGFVLSVVVAPVVEELTKGALVAGAYYFLRREFDGMVDGIVYAMVTALGFAAVENTAMYARAAALGSETFTQTFIVRGIVAPFGHPLYTSMIGVGFGLARESSRPGVRVAAPLLGFAAAVLLHALWNWMPLLGADVFVVSLVFWAAFVVAFTILVAALVIRKGRTIRRYLRDEVVVGTLDEADLRMVLSPFGRFASYFRPKGDVQRRLIRTAARLALSKWHVARAARRHRGTFSMEFIGPLRREVRELRALLHE
jgi:protease PrsW